MSFIVSLPSGAMTTIDLLPKPIEQGAKWSYALDRQGGLWLAYYDVVGALRLRSPSGLDTAIGNSTNDNPKSGLSLAGTHDGAAIGWREKFPQKRLFLAQGTNLDQAPLEFGAGTEPLTRMETLSIGANIHQLWYGERGDRDSQQRYHIYYQRFNAKDGKNSTAQRVLPGIYPIWAHDDKGNLLVVSWGPWEEGRSILVRGKPADSDEFGPVSNLADTAAAAPASIRAFSSKGRWFVIWQIAQEEIKQFVGAYSDDFGHSWKRFTFEGLGNFAAGSIDIAVGDEGHLFIAISGFDVNTAADKPDVRLATSADNGTTWAVTSPRSEKFARRFRAMNPVVVVGPNPGQVLVAWEDWRNLRAQIYLNYSENYGKSWKIVELPLTAVDGKHRSLTGTLKPAYISKEGYHLIIKEFLDDRLSQYKLLDLGLGVDDIEKLALTVATPEPSEPSGDTSGKIAKPTAAATVAAENTKVSSKLPVVPDSHTAEALLRKRVEIYWQAMVDHNFNAMYSMQDPFYRAQVSEDLYAKPLGRISYRDPVIEEVRMDGPLANVKVRVTVGIKPFRAKTGEMISRPDQTVDLDETWLWIDGDWYKEFYNEYMEKRYTLY